jgi:negative regulator of sigma E activity
MESKQLVEQMLGKKLQELNNNANEFIKWCADIILLDDVQQLELIETFRLDLKTFVEAQKNALEAEKLKAETELTQHINALVALDGKVEKVLKEAPVVENVEPVAEEPIV